MESNVIYALYDVRAPEVFRYVGQTREGVDTRFRNHLAQAKRGTRAYVYNWIRSIGAENLRVVTLEYFDSPESLNDAEVKWISACRTLGMPLTNVGNGGDSVWRDGKRPAQSLRMKGEANPMWGVKRPEVMEYARSFNKPMSEERREMLSARSRGTGNPRNVLTEDQVLSIRAEYETRHGIWAELARKYNVTPQAVRAIVKRQTWKHLE